MTMQKIQYSVIVALSILSGFLGGMVSSNFLSGAQVGAEMAPEGSSSQPDTSNVKTKQLKKELLQLMEEFETTAEAKKEKRKEYERSLKILKAQGFELVDKQGKTRAKLITDPEGNPYLHLRRDKEFLMIGFGTVTNGPELTMMKLSGSGMATAIASAEGIQVSNGQQFAILSVRPGEAPSAQLTGPNGSVVINMEGEAANMQLRGSSGGIILHAGQEDNSLLSVFNKASKVIWSAP